MRYELRSVGAGGYSRPGLLVPYAVQADFHVAAELDSPDDLMDAGALRLVFELLDMDDPVTWGRVYELRLQPVLDSTILLVGVSAAALVGLLDLAVAYWTATARAHREQGTAIPEAVLRV